MVIVTVIVIVIVRVIVIVTVVVWRESGEEAGGKGRTTSAGGRVREGEGGVGGGAEGAVGRAVSSSGAWEARLPLLLFLGGAVGRAGRLAMYSSGAQGRQKQTKEEVSHNYLLGRREWGGEGTPASGREGGKGHYCFFWWKPWAQVVVVVVGPGGEGKKKERNCLTTSFPRAS